MSLKLTILLVVALVGFQTASGFYLNDLEHLDDRANGDFGENEMSLFDPVNRPVTLLGQIMHLRPVKFVARILLFPITSSFRILRIMLTPVRILLLPVNIIYRVLYFITTPMRYLGRFIMNFLLLLPIVNIPVRVIIAMYRVITFPPSAIESSVRYLFGPSPNTLFSINY